MAAPIGNQHAAKAKQWQMSIERALEKRGRGDRKAALDEVAESLIDLAVSGDLAAMKEIGDRLDGKAAQSLSVAGDADNPLVTRIERVIVDPKT